MTKQPERGTLVGGRYRLEQILGEGGMAVVWRAVHTATDRAVALKLVRREFANNEQIKEMFVREARVGARIGLNPHIVEVFDAGIDPELEVPFLTMELLDGETLEARIQRDGPVAWEVAATILEQLAEALDQAHAAGVFHRDLKPPNLFLAKDRRSARDKQERTHVKVLDFGIAKLAESVHRSSTHVGTPAYAAPEQLGAAWRTLAAQRDKVIAAHVSAGTDVWAMGLLVYEMLIGGTSGSLWSATTLAELPVKIVLEPTPRASVRAGERSALLPEGFDAWIGRCLELDASKRFATVGEAVAVLVPTLRAGRQQPMSPPIPSLHPPAAPAFAVTPHPQPLPMPIPQAMPQVLPPAQHVLQPQPRQVAAWAPQQAQQIPPHNPHDAAVQARLTAWAHHWRAELRVNPDPRPYLSWNPFFFLPPIQHVLRDARVAVRDAQVMLAEIIANDPLRKLAAEERILIGLVLSNRVFYRVAVRSKITSGIVDGIGQMFESLASSPTLGDVHFEKHFDLRFPTVQEGQVALPFELRKRLMHAGFRGVLETRQGGFVLRRLDASRFEPTDLDKLLEAATGLYGGLAP